VPGERDVTDLIAASQVIFIVVALAGVGYLGIREFLNGGPQ
jgi:hypothetical protein